MTGPIRNPTARVWAILINLLEADIEEYDRLAEWRSIHEQLETLVSERRYRSGLFRPDLSVE